MTTITKAASGREREPDGAHTPGNRNLARRLKDGVLAAYLVNDLADKKFLMPEDLIAFRHDF